MATNEQEYDDGIAELDQNEQNSEDVLFDSLGLDEDDFEVKTPDGSGDDDTSAEEEGAEIPDFEREDEEEATQDEDYSPPDEELEDTSEDAEEVGEDETFDEEAAVEKAAESDPEYKAFLETEQRLRKMLAEKDQQLAEMLREREEAQVSEEKFITDEDDFDRIMSSPEGLNAVLNRVYRKGVASGKEETMKSFDVQLDNRVRLHLDRRTRAENFFKSNPELSTPKLREYVFLVGQELAEQHPDWDIDTFYSRLGTETKKRLGLASVAKQTAGKAKPIKQSSRTSGMNKAKGTRAPSKSRVRSLADEVRNDLGL